MRRNSMINSRALLLILVSSFLGGSMAFLVKLIAPVIPTVEALFFRSSFGVIVIAVIFLSGFQTLKIKDLRVLIIRGIAGGSSMLCLFLALSRIPLGEAVLLNNTYPVFTAIFSAILLKEKVTWQAYLALIGAFAGLFIIIPPFNIHIGTGHLIGLASGIFAGVAIVTIRQLRTEGENSYLIYFPLAAAGVLFSLPFISVKYVPPSLHEWGILLLIGLLALVGRVIFAHAFKYVSASEGSIVSVSTTVFATLMGVLFLNEALTINFLIGGALILGSGVYLIRLNKQPALP